MRTRASVATLKLIIFFFIISDFLAQTPRTKARIVSYHLFTTKDFSALYDSFIFQVNGRINCFTPISTRINEQNKNCFYNVQRNPLLTKARKPLLS